MVTVFTRVMTYGQRGVGRMNKREAKEMAHRLVVDLIEEYMSSKEPDVYGTMFAGVNGVDGLRLSESD